MLSNTPPPELNPAFAKSFAKIETIFLENCETICQWFEKQWQLTIPPIYGSVDLRNAGFKVAPIDMNLFPAGFNNLNPNYLNWAVTAAQKILKTISSSLKNILIIPESHTRNILYWENIKTLQNLLEKAGYTVKFATLDNDVTEERKIKLPSGSSLSVHPLLRQEDRLVLSDFTPDLVLLNNDLSEGIPEILIGLDQQVLPPAELGWSHRLKSDHFQYYAEVVEEFSQAVGIDPWLISPLFRQCGQINFMQKGGMECVERNANNLFLEIEKKYQEYGIKQQPFIIIKADAGTYGMAVMTLRRGEEISALNRKQRTRMSATKGGQPVNKVIIQEGVYTFETLGEDQAVAEPVVYLMGTEVIGGFYRIHKERGNDENLNSPGMMFEPIAFGEPCHEPCAKTKENSCQNRFYTYGVIAKLSMLAAAREMKHMRIP